MESTDIYAFGPERANRVVKAKASDFALPEHNPDDPWDPQVLAAYVERLEMVTQLLPPEDPGRINMTKAIEGMRAQIQKIVEARSALQDFLTYSEKVMEMVSVQAGVRVEVDFSE